MTITYLYSGENSWSKFVKFDSKIASVAFF